jgi:hypothetical protein
MFGVPLCARRAHLAQCCPALLSTTTSAATSSAAAVQGLPLYFMSRSCSGLGGTDSLVLQQLACLMSRSFGLPPLQCATLEPQRHAISPCMSGGRGARGASQCLQEFWVCFIATLALLQLILLWCCALSWSV